jgi:hypothetical protein
MNPDYDLCFVEAVHNNERSFSPYKQCWGILGRRHAPSLVHVVRLRFSYSGRSLLILFRLHTGSGHGFKESEKYKNVNVSTRKSRNIHLSSNLPPSITRIFFTLLNIVKFLIIHKKFIVQCGNINNFFLLLKYNSWSKEQFAVIYVLIIWHVRVLSWYS